METALTGPITDGATTDPKLTEAAETLGRLRAAAVDARIGTGGLQMLTTRAEDLGTLAPADRVVLHAHTPSGPMRLAILEGAHEQVADRVGIPAAYYRRMLAEAPDLLAVNVNRWFQQNPDVRMLRMLKPITAGDEARLARTSVGSHLDTRYAVRAFLGASYRPLDHFSLLGVLLPTLMEAGARVKEFHLDERHFHIRLLTRERDLAAYGPEELRGLLNEVIRAGVAIRNSETGHGSVSVEPFLEVLRCTNGMVVNDATRLRHQGKRQGEDGAEAWLGEDTKRLDDAAVFLRIRDRVVGTMDEQQIGRHLGKIAAAAGEPLALPPALPLMEFVENVGRSFELTRDEIGILQEETVHEMRERPAYPLSRFTVAQAMTATARRIGEGGAEGEGADFGRKVDLERNGWKILDDPVAALLRAGQHATRRN